METIGKIKPDCWFSQTFKIDEQTEISWDELVNR
jgi:hypothetical protein